MTTIKKAILKKLGDDFFSLVLKFGGVGSELETTGSYNRINEEMDGQMGCYRGSRPVVVTDCSVPENLRRDFSSYVDFLVAIHGKS
jgi:hypothetical protein